MGHATAPAACQPSSRTTGGTVEPAAGAANGATVTWTLKRGEDDAAALLSKAIGTGITLLNQTTNKGQFTITLAAANTTSLGGASYYHESTVTDVSANVSRVLRGIVTIKNALT